MHSSANCSGYWMWSYCVRNIQEEDIYKEGDKTHKEGDYKHT